MYDEELAFLFALQDVCFGALPAWHSVLQSGMPVGTLWSELKRGTYPPGVRLTELQRFRLREFSIKTFLSKWHPLKEDGVEAISLRHPDYPSCFLHMPQPPLVIFCRGDSKLMSEPKRLAVVGTRAMSSYGQRVLEHLIPALVAHGFVLVSGLAMGVDVEAHKLTLQHQGLGIAVQAQGVDQGYPAQNQAVFSGLIQDGLVVSEYPSPPQIVHHSLFPRRNRLISALSDGVLVIEAGEKSGSLITAGFAMDEGKTVYVIPGEVFRAQSQGCHALLKTGAKMVTGIDDVLEDFSSQAAFAKVLPREFSFATVLEKQIFDLCLAAPRTTEDLADSTGEPVSRLLSVICMMELNGVLKDDHGIKRCAK